MLRKSLYKTSVFYYLINPLFYFSAIITVFFSAFRFFVTQKFFVQGLGTSDLRTFFQSVAFVSVAVIPVLVLRIKKLLDDDSLPFSPVSRFFTLALGTFTAFVFPLILLFSVPVSVNFFGDVEIGQVFTGFFGLFLFAFASISLSICLFSAISSQSLALILSITILFGTNFIHLIPLYLDVGSFLRFLCQKLSFSFAFAPFEKGILDSRSIVFYIYTSVIFILISVFFEKQRLGKKTSSLTIILFSLIFIFSSLGFEKIYFRIDFTKAKQFSVSKTSRNLVSKLEEPLRITYFRSRELSDLYPQSSDVLEFLEDFSLSGKNISLTVKNISSKDDSKPLSDLGIRGQQVKNEKGTKTEFITIYSSVLIQYLDKNSLIPFIVSTENLEYDLCQRLKTLISEQEQKVYLISGNGNIIEENYDYLIPWLSVRGFSPETLNEHNMVSVLENISAQDEIIIFGSKSLSQNQCAAIEQAVMNGTPAIIMTSPYSVDLENGWNIRKNSGDNLLPALNAWGFSFGNSLIQDIACFPLMMETSDSGKAEYTTMNYPLWITAFPNERMKAGATFFWSSPLILYGNSKPISETSNLAWLQNQSDSEENPFITSPFLLKKTAKEDGKINVKSIFAATTDKIEGFYQKGSANAKVTVISGENFVNSLMTGYISSETSGDFRNFDFIATELLRLGNKEELVQLLEKSNFSKQLYKISDENQLKAGKMKVYGVIFVLIPILIIVFFIIVQVKRNERKTAE